MDGLFVNDFLTPSLYDAYIETKDIAMLAFIKSLFVRQPRISRDVVRAVIATTEATHFERRQWMGK